MTNTGRVVAIWIKRDHGRAMDSVRRARLVTGMGIVGNADFAAKRQVTLIELEVFASLPAHIREAVDPSVRRANVMTSGVRLARMAGHVLHIGPCRILIRGEAKPCHRMDQACPGLVTALEPDWGGGAWGDVLDDGEIQVGDAVRWVREPSRSADSAAAAD
jgi:MOSC domain-containing protein YiiM